MKKPIKPTEKDVAAAVAKRKHLMRKEKKNLVSGDLEKVNEQVLKFAQDNEVSVSEVKFTFGSYNSYMSVRRPETYQEKTARIRYDLNDKYRTKKWSYDRWVRQQAAQRAAAPVHNVNVNCCNCKCRG